MRNPTDIDWAVYNATWKAVYWAVEDLNCNWRKVNGSDEVFWGLERPIAVRWEIGGVVHVVKNFDPEHPALQDFLRSAKLARAT